MASSTTTTIDLPNIGGDPSGRDIVVIYPDRDHHVIYVAARTPRDIQTQVTKALQIAGNPLSEKDVKHLSGGKETKWHQTAADVSPVDTFYARLKTWIEEEDNQNRCVRHVSPTSTGKREATVRYDNSSRTFTTVRDYMVTCSNGTTIKDVPQEVHYLLNDFYRFSILGHEWKDNCPKDALIYAILQRKQQEGPQKKSGEILPMSLSEFDMKSHRIRGLITMFGYTLEMHNWTLTDRPAMHFTLRPPSHRPHWEAEEFSFPILMA